MSLGSLPFAPQGKRKAHEHQGLFLLGSKCCGSQLLSPAALWMWRYHCEGRVGGGHHSPPKPLGRSGRSHFSPKGPTKHCVYLCFSSSPCISLALRRAETPPCMPTMSSGSWHSECSTVLPGIDSQGTGTTGSGWRGEALRQLRRLTGPGMVAQACNPNTPEAECWEDCLPTLRRIATSLRSLWAT